MSYSLVITKDGEIIVERDISADDVIKLLAQPAAPVTKAAKKPRQASGELQLARGGRRHPLTEKIEEMLVDGKSVTEITDQCEASAPTIYAIKARLKSQGLI